MTQRAGSADLPLHGGRVPEWLAGRMAKLGAVIAEGWLRWVLVAAAILLPYVAVVFANTEGRRDDGFLLDDPGSATPPAELPDPRPKGPDTP